MLFRSDLNTASGYAGQPYLEDFINAHNAQTLYSAFEEMAGISGSRIYEVNAEGIPVNIGTGFTGGESAERNGAGTHTRSTVLSAAFIVDAGGFDLPQTGDEGDPILPLFGFGTGFAILLFAILKGKTSHSAKPY